MAKLLVQESAGVREFELVDNEVRIGRELDNALRLADPSISRHHAVIRLTPSGYEVQDLQSSNGVLVNGNRVQTALLQDGDRVTLGQLHLTFSNPQHALGTVILQAGAPESPLGTVRMDPSEMAKIQGHIASRPADAPPRPAPPRPTPPPPVAAPPAPLPPTPMAPMAPPLPPSPAIPAPLPPPGPAAAPPPMPAPVPVAYAPPPPVPAPPIIPPTPMVQPPLSTPGEPYFLSGDLENPAPGFLQRFLPSVPDDAEPIFGFDGFPERGDFVARLLAHLIDGAVFMVPMVLIWILFFVGANIPGLNVVVAAVGCLLFPLMGLLGLGYMVFTVWCLMKFGATIGKKAMKLRVVPELDPQTRMDIGQAILRLVGHMVNGILFGLPYLMILGAERKGPQDIFSNTIVIKVDR